MPYDITHCCGQGCPLQESCLRCTATICGRQDFFTHLPYDFNRAYCDYYLDDRPTEEAIRQLAHELWEKNGYQQNSALAHWLDARTQLIDYLRNT